LRASSTLVTPRPAHTLIRFGEFVVLPIQLNARASNSTPGVARAWMSGVFCEAMSIGAVARRHLSQPVEPDDAGATGHVARHDRGRASQILHDMPRYQPGLEVRRPAWREVDEESDRLPAIEIVGLRDRRGRGKRESRDSARQRCIQARSFTHIHLPAFGVAANFIS